MLISAIDIQSVFRGSKDYARLAGRSLPNAFDLLKARDEVEKSSMGKMNREGKRRRKGQYLLRLNSHTIPYQSHIVN